LDKKEKQKNKKSKKNKILGDFKGGQRKHSAENKQKNERYLKLIKEKTQLKNLPDFKAGQTQN